MFEGEPDAVESMVALRPRGPATARWWSKVEVADEPSRGPDRLPDSLAAPAAARALPMANSAPVAPADSLTLPGHPSGPRRSRIRAVGSLSRSQLLVYGAVGVTLLLLGARWIRSAESGGARRGRQLLDRGLPVGLGLLRRRRPGRRRRGVDVAGGGREARRLQAARGSRSTTPCSGPDGRRRRRTGEINLAARLADGQQVVVPERAAAPGGGGSPGRARTRRHRSAWARRPSRSSTRSRESGRSLRRASSTTATSTAASPRSNSSTRSTGSARRPWTRCASGSSPERRDAGRRALRGPRGRDRRTGALAARRSAGAAPPGLLAASAVALTGLVAARPRRGSDRSLRLDRARCARGGCWAGCGRRHAARRDRRRCPPTGPSGGTRPCTGFVTAVPRRSGRRGDASASRPATVGSRSRPRAGPGSADRSRDRRAGTIAEPRPGRPATCCASGSARSSEPDRLRLTERRRGGPAAFVDGVRERAEAALGRGTPAPEAALLRGFLLGEDDRIDGGDGRRLQALRPRAPARGLRGHGDAARAARGRRCWRSSGCRFGPG